MLGKSATWWLSGMDLKFVVVVVVGLYAEPGLAEYIDIEPAALQQVALEFVKLLSKMGYTGCSSRELPDLCIAAAGKRQRVACQQMHRVKVEWSESVRRGCMKAEAATGPIEAEEGA